MISIACFNKRKFAKLLDKAKGNRSINQYALHSGVTSAHISRLLRELLDNPPTPQTIYKLAKHAYNGVSYHELMDAAGYNPEKKSSHENDENKALSILRKTHPDIVELIERASGLPKNQQEIIAVHWKWALDVVCKQEEYKAKNKEILHVAEENKSNKYQDKPEKFPEDDNIDIRSTPMAANINNEDIESIPLTPELEDLLENSIRESRQKRREREQQEKRKRNDSEEADTDK